MEPVLVKPALDRTRRPWVQRVIVAAVALVAAGLAASLVGPPLLAWAAKAVVEKKLVEVARVLGREITLRRVSSGLSDALVLDGVEVRSRDGRHATLSVERVALDFSLWDAMWGRRSPSRVEATGTRVTLLLDGGRPQDALDLVRGLRAHLAGPSSVRETGADADAVPPLPELHVTGEVAVLNGDEAEPAVRLLDGDLVVRRAGDTLEARFGARAVGLGSEPTRIVGTVAARSRRDFDLEVRAGSPLEPTVLTRDFLPVAVRGKGVFVTSTPDQTEVRLEGVEVPELASLQGAPVVGRFLSHAGLVSAGEVRVTFSGDIASLARGTLPVPRAIAVRDGSAHLVPATPGLSPLRLRGLNATLHRDGSGRTTLRLDGEATAGRMGFSRVEGQARLDPDGQVEEVRLSLAGPILVEMVSGIHGRLLPWPGARADLTLFARRDGSRWGVTGHVVAQGLTYFWTKVCLVPVTDLGFEADVRAEVDPAAGEVSVRLDPLRWGEARLAVDFKAVGLPHAPRFEVGLSLPRQPCDAVARAIPRVLIPRLDGARFEGMVGLQARFVADLERPERSSLSVVPDVEECRALTLGPRVDVERLNSDRFIFEINEKDYDKKILVGPGTRDYVPIEHIPVVVQQAALATEDMAFFRHQGFRIGLINRAIKLNLGEGWYVYGGSTISQQLVKNLFLSREKTLARKLEEAIVVWEMERRVEKERILELYLNCIEFGRHVYGIRAAARTYFGKEVRDLTPMDAAFIMATKPGPRYAHKVYESRSFNEWWVRRMKGILERLWREMHVIDERAARTPDPCPPGGPRGRYLVPCFYYPDDGTYAQPAVAPGTEVPPGMPENLPGGEGPAPAPTAPEAAPATPATPRPDAGPGRP